MGRMRNPTHFQNLTIFNFKPFTFTLILSVFILCVFTLSVNASRGDRDYTFHNCLPKCRKDNCTGHEYNDQPQHLKYLLWDCDEECKYRCMWHTVNIFQSHELPVPQFYGKWPFIRFFGVQEPASVLFSVFNLFIHVHGILKLNRKVPMGTPLLSLWYIFAAVSVNGWIASIAFHTRDFPMTELLDYFSAFFMNAFSFFAVFVRLFERWLCLPVVSMGCIIMTFSAYHVHYLTYVKFDYGYNMAANIAMGILNASCWLIWSGVNRNHLPHVKKCTIFVLLAVFSLVLEVFDFPPIFWFIDAHALWHLVTAPLTMLWYSFLKDDCRFLHEKSEKSKKM